MMRRLVTGSVPVAGVMLMLVSVGQAQTRVATHASARVEGKNTHYVSNRAPLLPSPLIKLPPGAVHAEGWLRTQLELEAEGMIGYLHELSPWCKLETSAWKHPETGERGWEEAPYWLKGFADLGLLLENERILDEWKRWLEAILASQQEDGCFGPLENKRSNDWWPNMIMLYPLRSWYEATGDERIIPFMLRYFRFLDGLPKGKLFEQLAPRGWWQHIRGADNLDSIHWLYNHTGEKWLLDLARRNHEETADWTGGMPSWHGVNICECFRGPAQFYQQSRDDRHLRATLRIYNTVMDMYGQVPGGMFGADENCREGYRGPRQAAETCSMAEMMYSHQMLTRITGDGLWADRCEDVAFNSLPAATTPDFKGLHYLTAPNQVQLDRKNKAPMIQNHGDMFSYSPYEQYRCCQHNVAFGWPYYTEHLWMATPGNGLAAVLYAPSTVTAKVGDGTEVTIREETAYPFEEEITLTVDAPRAVEFPLTLRVPAWCERPQVWVNDEQVEASSKPGEWLVITRTWSDGDTVRLDLPMAIRAKVWPTNKGFVSVHRGPLAYSLEIKEKWAEYDNGRDWAAHEVLPDSPWNVGLVIDPQNPAASIKVLPAGEGADVSEPFTPQSAPVRLQARARRIPGWSQEYNGMVGAMRQSPVRSDEPVEDVTLIPMGCARLRIAAFPRIGAGPQATPWPVRQASYFASHVENDLDAIGDGIAGKSSNDRSVPRLTWWDHKGTGEWVEFHFRGARELDTVAVQWYDDRETGGLCRVPKSWKVQYQDPESKTWHEAKNKTPYGTERDVFNEVTLEPVKTHRVRIWAELQPDHSGGILEVRFNNKE